MEPIGEGYLEGQFPRFWTRSVTNITWLQISWVTLGRFWTLKITQFEWNLIFQVFQAVIKRGLLENGPLKTVMFRARHLHSYRGFSSEPCLITTEGYNHSV